MSIQTMTLQCMTLCDHVTLQSFEHIPIILGPILTYGQGESDKVRCAKVVPYLMFSKQHMRIIARFGYFE